MYCIIIIITEPLAGIAGGGEGVSRLISALITASLAELYQPESILVNDLTSAIRVNGGA